MTTENMNQNKTITFKKVDQPMTQGGLEPSVEVSGEGEEAMLGRMQQNVIWSAIERNETEEDHV